MINFHIPGIINHLEINIKLIKLIKSNPEYFYDNINISGIYGSFYCPWNGGRTNSSFLDFNIKQKIIKFFNNLNVGILFTYTNTMLEQRDLYDMYGNEDLKLISSNSLNKIIIVSDLLKQYIRSQYPNIKFISSIASNINNTQDYDICVINANKNNTQELFDIKNKSKIELLVNSNCIKNCPFEKKHYDNISMINLSKQTEYFKCPYKKDSMNSLEEMSKSEIFISVDNLYNQYVPKGFNIFKINGRHVGNNDIISYYLYYMVKPEYQEIVKNIFESINPDKSIEEILEEYL